MYGVNKFRPPLSPGHWMQVDAAVIPLLCVPGGISDEAGTVYRRQTR
jgi:hypothetical protein